MNARILVIDDDPVSRSLVAWLLKARGHVVLDAADGRTGMERVRADAPDLVLCDVQLPDADGRDLARRLKQDPATAAIPLLALTASITDEERATIAEAGFDGRIDKPIEPEGFATQVEAWL